MTSARDWQSFTQLDYSSTFFALFSGRNLTSESTIEFNKKALNKDSEEYQTLHNGVKKVLGVVVGLLKDGACAGDDSPSKKIKIKIRIT